VRVGAWLCDSVTTAQHDGSSGGDGGRRYTDTRWQARMHACTHARMHASARQNTHTHTHTHTQPGTHTHSGVTPAGRGLHAPRGLVQRVQACRGSAGSEPVPVGRGGGGDGDGARDGAGQGVARAARCQLLTPATRAAASVGAAALERRTPLAATTHGRARALA
jgi:hypothetical protein